MIAVRARHPEGRWWTEAAKLAAFFRRDLLIAWSYRVGFMTGLAGLIAQALAFSLLGRMVNHDIVPQYGGAQPDYTSFAVVGIALSSLLNIGIGRMTQAVRSEQLMGTLEALLVTPTSPATLQLGLVVYDLVDVPLRTGLFLALTTVLFGIDLQVQGIGPALAILAVFLPFVWGVGAASAGAVMAFRHVTGLVGLGTYALGIISGAFFPLELLPPWLSAVMRYNPVAVALQATREALLGGTGWNETIPSLVLLAPMSAVMFVLGLALFRLAERAERRAGTLGMY